MHVLHAYILETTARFSTYIHVLNTARKYGLYSACITHALLTACAASVCACACRERCRLATQQQSTKKTEKVLQFDLLVIAVSKDDWEYHLWK